MRNPSLLRSLAKFMLGVLIGIFIHGWASAQETSTQGSSANEAPSDQTHSKNLRGKVMTPTGEPAQNANIVLFAGLFQKRTTATTDDLGNFEIDFATDSDPRFARIGVYHPSGSIAGKSGFATDMNKLSVLEFKLKKCDPLIVSVAGPDGEPIKKGSINLVSIYGPGGNGVSSFGNVVPPVMIVEGKAKIGYANQRDTIVFEIRAAGFPAQSAFWQIDADQTRVQLQPQCRVIGKIADAEGLGFDNVKLKLTSFDRELYGAGKKTSSSVVVEVKADGTFETNALTPGKLKLELQRDVTSKWYVVEKIYPEKVPAVELSSTKPTNLNLTMKRAVFVKGNVTGPDGKPQPDVHLNLQTRVVTDAKGEYSGYFEPGAIHGQFLKVPKGMLTPGGRFGMINFVVPENAKEFIAPSFRLERAVPISGFVVDENREPVASASVVAVWMARMDGGVSTQASDLAKTDEFGKFVLEKTDGKVVINVSVASKYHAGSAVVRPGAKRDIEIRAKKRDLMAIKVAAVSQTGKPIEGATFELWNHRGRSSSIIYVDSKRKLAADSDGQLKTPIQFGRESRFSVIVTAPGYSSFRTKPTSAPRKGHLDFGPIKLKLSNTVRGKIVDSEGKPIPDATIWSFGSSDQHRRTNTSVQSDSTGGFELTGIAPQSYFFFIEHSKYRFTGKRIPNDAQTPVKIELALPTQSALDQPVSIGTRSAELRESAVADLLQSMLGDEKSVASDFTLVRIIDLLAKIDRKLAVSSLKKINRDDRRLKAVMYVGEIEAAIELARTLPPEQTVYTLTNVIRGISYSQYHPGIVLTFAQKKTLLAEATSFAAQMDNIDQRVSAYSTLAVSYRRLGDKESSERLIQKIQKLGATNELSDITAQSFARAIAPTDPKAALNTLTQIDREFTRRRSTGDAVAAAGFGGHEAVKTMLNAAEQRTSHAGSLRRAVFELAQNDLDKTVEMVDSAEDRYNGINTASSYGIMALAVHKQHPGRAKQLLRKAFEMLGPHESQYKDRVTFTLLRYAESVDPKSTGEYWWRAVADHGGPSPSLSNRAPEKEIHERRGSLAILLSLYGKYPDVRKQLTDPLFEYWESVEPYGAFGEGTRGVQGGHDFRNSISTVAAMALEDPERTVALMKKWWPAGYQRFNHSPDSAWIIVAEMLSYQGTELSRLISKRLHNQWLVGDDYRN